MGTPHRNRHLLGGQRFGRLVALDEPPRRAEHRYQCCHCDCGLEAIVAQTQLFRGQMHVVQPARPRD
jgi:hypothetical protein